MSETSEIRARERGRSLPQQRPSSPPPLRGRVRRGGDSYRGKKPGARGGANSGRKALGPRPVSTAPCVPRLRDRGPVPRSRVGQLLARRDIRDTPLPQRSPRGPGGLLGAGAGAVRRRGRGPSSRCGSSPRGSRISGSTPPATSASSAPTPPGRAPTCATECKGSAPGATSASHAFPTRKPTPSSARMARSSSSGVDDRT